MENLKENGKSDKDLTTLASCLNVLIERGYTEDFKVNEEGLKSIQTKKVYQPEDVKIANFYRFEGESDPADMAILYAIETNSGAKGTLVDAYGPYASRKVAEFIKKVEDISKLINPDEAGEAA